MAVEDPTRVYKGHTEKGPIQVNELMKLKCPTKVKMSEVVNLKQGGGEYFFASSARELILCSPTFRMMAALLNVVH